MDRLQSIIDQLGLAPLPHEGGWFRQYHLSPERDAAGRPRASAIHFLMSTEGFSALHRLQTPETWRWREGAAVELLLLGPGAIGRLVVLGPEARRDQVAKFTVPGGVWQGARPRGPWALVDCAMSPAWDEREFELGERTALTRTYPAWAEQIRQLTREQGGGI